MARSFWSFSKKLLLFGIVSEIFQKVINKRKVVLGHQAQMVSTSGPVSVSDQHVRANVMDISREQVCNSVTN